MSLQKAKDFVTQLTSRRSIYALGRRSILSDAQLIDLIKSTVRQSPSAFNSQSSRVVILLGKEHERYWEEVAVPSLRKTVNDDAKFKKGSERMKQFRDAYGTALFYEDQGTVKSMQEKVQHYADRFPEWSIQSCGMAQINTWTALELAGYGANLQHYGNLTQEPLTEAFGISKDWKLYAELVFGSPENGVDEKSFIDDDKRFSVFGSH